MSDTELAVSGRNLPDRRNLSIAVHVFHHHPSIAKMNDGHSKYLTVIIAAIIIGL